MRGRGRGREAGAARRPRPRRAARRTGSDVVMAYVATSAAARCAEKRRYESRMAAEAALGAARNQWRRDRTRAPAPPVRVYQCAECGYGWHLTSQPEQLRTPLRTGPAGPRPTAAETMAAARAFERGQRVTYLGGAKAGAAPWLEAGSDLTVLGPVRSRGRGYVRLAREGDGRRTTLAPRLIRASA